MVSLFEMKLLGVTKNHCEVYVDMDNSHAATHFADSPKLYNAVIQTLPTIELVGTTIRMECDAGEEVGESDVVETNSHDEIVYALRPYRDRYSRFVKNKTAVATHYITLSFKQIQDTRYELYTAYVGQITPSFPGGDYLPEQSKDFWSKHALVWGNQAIIPGTETTECPW